MKKNVSLPWIQLHKHLQFPVWHNITSIKPIEGVYWRDQIILPYTKNTQGLQEHNVYGRTSVDHYQI